MYVCISSHVCIWLRTTFPLSLIDAVSSFKALIFGSVHTYSHTYVCTCVCVCVCVCVSLASSTLTYSHTHIHACMDVCVCVCVCVCPLCVSSLHRGRHDDSTAVPPHLKHGPSLTHSLPELLSLRTWDCSTRRLGQLPALWVVWWLIINFYC